MLTDTSKSPYAKAYPLKWDAVRWTGEFWKDCEDMCDDHGIGQLKRMFDDKDISHVVENFKIVAGDAEGDFDGTVFGDGDFYKWLEAAMYSAYRRDDDALKEEIEQYIDLIGRAQQPDGYLSTKQILGERKQNGVQRMGDINDFEVYNFGHLFTSACLHKRITGKDKFLEIAKKAADYLDVVYHKAALTGEVQTAVCPSHYMGLVELYRTTGEERYLTLAALAIKLRDSVKNGTDDNQDRIPLKKHTKAIGHAVRSSYLYAGVADLYAETGDHEYLEMMEKVWYNLTHYKMYITGGCGALYNGASPYGNFFIDQKVHQAHGYEYQLPNITAYNETCAAVGNVMWAYRMFLDKPKAEYFDVIEKTLLNTLLAAISLDGKKYFYENMLQRAKKLEYELLWPLSRTEYITSYCCPPNLLRMLEQSSEYAYAVDKDTIWTGIYGASRAVMKLENGADFVLEQTTAYPYEGMIKLECREVKQDKPVKIKIRIPSWVERGTVCCRCEEVESISVRIMEETHLLKQTDKVELSGDMAGSYMEISIPKLLGTVLEICFDMPVYYMAANPMVEEDNGKVAVMRGPICYCVEHMDIDEDTLDHIVLPEMPEFDVEACTICDRSIRVLTGEVYVKEEEFAQNMLYEKYKPKGYHRRKIRMIPYFAWDNRSYGEMKIWLPVKLI